MSLSALAAAAGIGKGSLSELETGRRNPTLATLYAVAAPLQVALASLLGDEVGATVTDDGVRTRLLDSRRRADGSVVEVYTLRLDPGARRESPAHGTGVMEHLTVTDGAFEVTRRAGAAEETLRGGSGESLTWVSDVPHAYAAMGSGPAEGVLVIVTPDRGADPAR
jgi:transcriptional regulator with XRE-family HTH domain